MIYDVLAHIKKRPGMYLGKPSMNALGSYVHGFEHALALAHIPPQEDDEEFEHFKKWLAKEFHGANLGWNGQILFLVSGNDPLWWRKDEKLEEQALERFFALLEQYSSGLFQQAETRVSVVLEQVAQEVFLHNQKIFAEQKRTRSENKD